MLRALVAAAQCIALVAVATGCGSDSPQQRPASAGPQLNAPIRLANCRDWKGADAGQRLGTVRQLRSFAGGPVGSSALKRGPVLDDEQALKLLNNYCSKRYARGFKLYKLYTRAAGFAGH